MEFYPTPKTLLDQIFEGADWKKIETVLEPSAGKGDIVEYIHQQDSEIDIDCIEIEENLQHILTGKGYRLVWDNFLTYQTAKRYDLIVMNPPFSYGDEHLLKALKMQKDGGMILCILNAETLKNPWSLRRKELQQKLKLYQADISFLTSPFHNAERSTEVDVAVVKVCIPQKKRKSIFFEELRDAQSVPEMANTEMTDLAENDYIAAIVKRYEIEAGACIRLIHEYQGMKPYILESVKQEFYTKPILELKIGEKDLSNHPENRVLKLIRKKYWEALFADERFISGMTSKQLNSYREQIRDLQNYDFSYFNIKTLQEQMAKSYVEGVEETILELFDKLSHEHAWLPETQKNIHYYNGWSTNKAHMINPKVIIPVYNVFSDIFHKFHYTYTIVEPILDIEKVFDYLNGTPQRKSDLLHILEKAEKEKQSKKIECHYFTLTFYKKGTCHIVFKDLELLKKFNIFGSQKKGWLPPCYGKKKYSDMTIEEKKVIDEFEGAETYQNVEPFKAQLLLVG